MVKMVLKDIQRFRISVKNISPYNLERVLSALYDAFNVERVDLHYYRIRGGLPH